MDRFGFDASRQLDYPRDERAASGECVQRARSSRPPTARSTSGAWRSARTSCAVTPLQMAMVAAAVANGGVLMKPHLADRIVDPDGRTVDDASQPEEMSQVMTPETAAQVGGDDEPGRRGGHRHRGRARRASTWPARPAPPRSTSPVRHQPALVHRLRAGAGPARRDRGDRRVRRPGFGGTVAAPIAKAVMQELLQVTERLDTPRRSSTAATASLHRLGSGGMADVYCAEDLQLGRKVALKLLHRRFAEDPRVRRALPPRGVERRRPAAPERRRRLRPRRVGRHLLHRDGVPRGPLAQAARPARRRRSSPTRAIDLVDPDPARRALRPPPRDHPPRPQAPQRDRRRRGPRQGHRLRHRPRRRVGHDRDRLDHGHRAVPVARAGPGPRGRARASDLYSIGSCSTSC